MVMEVIVHCFELKKDQGNKCPDQRGPFPDVLSCESSM